jgi:hypothetical protein
MRRGRCAAVDADETGHRAGDHRLARGLVDVTVAEEVRRDGLIGQRAVGVELAPDLTVALRVAAALVRGLAGLADEIEAHHRRHDDVGQRGHPRVDRRRRRDDGVGRRRGDTHVHERRAALSTVAAGVTARVAARTGVVVGAAGMTARAAGMTARAAGMTTRAAGMTARAAGMTARAARVMAARATGMTARATGMTARAARVMAARATGMTARAARVMATRMPARAGVDFEAARAARAARGAATAARAARGVVTADDGEEDGGPDDGARAAARRIPEFFVHGEWVPDPPAASSSLPRTARRFPGPRPGTIG